MELGDDIPVQGQGGVGAAFAGGILYGDDGADIIVAGAGDDLIIAGDQNDEVTAGAGDDHYVDGLGEDEVDGGPGFDTIDLSELPGRGTSGGYFIFGAWDDATGGLQGQGQIDSSVSARFTSAERLIGSNKNDTMIVAGSPDSLSPVVAEGVRGNDGIAVVDGIAIGGPGNDTVTINRSTSIWAIGDGNDAISAASNSTGGNVVELHMDDGTGAASSVAFSYNASNGELKAATQPLGEVQTMKGMQTIVVFTDPDGTSITGQNALAAAGVALEIVGPDGSRADVTTPQKLVGGIKHDVLRGGQQRDLLSGKGGDDELYGGMAEILLRAGPGDDLLASGAGQRDTSVGGGGRDTFYFGAELANGRVELDIIRKFDMDKDTLDLGGALISAVRTDRGWTEVVAGADLDIIRIDGLMDAEGIPVVSEDVLF